MRGPGWHSFRLPLPVLIRDIERSDNLQCSKSKRKHKRKRSANQKESESKRHESVQPSNEGSSQQTEDPAVLSNNVVEDPSQVATTSDKLDVESVDDIPENKTPDVNVIANYI